MKVVFDLDGTLIDSMAELRGIAVDLISESYKISPYVADEGYISTLGRSFKEQLDILFPRHKQNVKVADRFREEHADVYRYVHLHFGTVETIEWLLYKGFDVGVASSSPTALVHDVVKRLLPEITGTVMGRDVGPKAKQVMTQLAATPLADRWFIGDTPFDATVAHEVQATFHAVEHTFPKRVFSEANIQSSESLPDVADYISNKYSVVGEKEPKSLPEKRVGNP